MSLRRELAGLDRTRLGHAFDGAFDKCTSFEETGIMVDELADGFPALSHLVGRLGVRIGEELDDEMSRTNAVLGGVLVLLALVEHATAEEMRMQFPDAPETSTT